MASSTRAQAAGGRGPALGAISLGMGLLACTGVTLIWLVSTANGFDMPGWLRIVSGWAFPVGVVGAVAFGIAARMRSARGLATAGFVTAVVATIEFVVMIAANPY